MGEDNPILLIHDVGAGGLSNAIPESVAHSDRGGRIDLRTVPSVEPGMSPVEIWCNEAQERYVLIIAAKDVERFAELCERERCPFSVVGETTDDGWLKVGDPLLKTPPVDLPLDVMLGKPPKMTRDVQRLPPLGDDFSTAKLDVRDAAYRLLRFPAIADKTFLITIGDRTVGGMISRDPMVGPWQVPVSDVAVTLSDYTSATGEAMAMGERTPLALLDAPASGRMAVAEAVTNIAAADIAALDQVRLSANWMAACGEPGEDADLYATVKAVGEEFCPALGITIPVGKDSLSMKTSWQSEQGARRMVAPLSLIISAFAPVRDVRRTLTPQLRTGRRQLAVVDRSRRRSRSARRLVSRAGVRQARQQAPDCDDPQDAGEFLCRHRRAARGRFDRCLSRSLRRRFVRHARRNGVRRPLRRRCRSRHGSARSERRRCSAKSWAPCCRFAPATRRRCCDVLDRHGLASMSRVIGTVNDGDRVRIRAAASRCSMSRAPICIVRGRRPASA